MKLVFSFLALAIIVATWLLRAEIHQPQIYHVKQGMGFYQVSKALNSTALLILSKVMHTQLKAGYYQIDKDMRVIDLLNDFDNARVKTAKITLIEGKTVQDYFAQLSQNQALKSSGNFTQTMKLAGVEPPYEGYFLPESYQVNYGDSVASVLKRAYFLLQEKLNKYWLSRTQNQVIEDKHALLTLASLIEKEATSSAEKPLIAGVFINRLQQRMRLQTDPSVIYALGDKYSGTLKKQDLRIQHPYNTYRNKGLPPGAISSVGADSLWAAAHPKPHGYLYFVAKPDGTHAFAKTYKQHRLNIKKYLK